MVLDQWLLHLLTMSLTASFVILIILPIRFLLRRVPKIFPFALWAVVFFRLLCPISIYSNISLFGWLETPVAVEENVEASLRYMVSLTSSQGAAADVTPELEMELADQRAPLEQPPFSQAEKRPLSVASVIWCGGTGALLLGNLLLFTRFHRKLIGAVRLQKNIYLADYLQAPIIIGIIRPKIFLPSDLSESEQVYIVAHEKYHIRRGDQIYKFLSFVALCIHWFNPLVWLAFILFERDMEMSCDEGVLGKFDSQIRADYARSLLRFTTGRSRNSGVSLAFVKGSTKERIKNVMTYKKRTPMTIIAFTLLVCALSGCLSTDPMTTPSTAQTDSTAAAADVERERPLSEVALAAYQGDVSAALMPLDWTFSRADVPVLMEALENSNYFALYVDSEFALRMTADAVIEVSYNGGSAWNAAAYDLMDAEDFSIWLFQNDPIPGYAMGDLQKRLESGAEVRHIEFSAGKEIYFVIDESGVQLELVQLEKIPAILMDGQRIMLTSSSCNPFRFSNDMLDSFQNLLKSCSIASGSDTENEWNGLIEHLKNNGAEFIT